MTEIQEFILIVKKTISTRDRCRECPLFGAPSVVLDTNRYDIGPVDLAFIGLNPGIKEVELDTPFVGPAGQQLRKRIKTLPQGTTYLITNFILCHTENESKIPEPEQVIKNCLPLVRGIVKRFPAKLYVPLGAKAMKVCRINGSISKVSGQIFSGNILPLIHPSATLRPSKSGNRNNSEIFDQGFKNIITFLNKNNGPKYRP